MPGNYLPIGGAVLANTTTANNESRPITVALPDGGYLTAWVSDEQDQSGKGLYAQRFDVFGQPQGAEFRLNSTTYGDQQTLSLRETAEGFVAVWESWRQDGSGWGVVMQRFSAEATPLGPEVVVNTTTGGGQIAPGVGVLSNGNIVVTWMQWSEAAYDDVIKAQIFTAGGQRVGGEFEAAVGVDLNVQRNLSPYYTGERTFPGSEVVALENGGFGIVWRDYRVMPGVMSSSDGLLLQKFNADGSANGGWSLLAPVSGSNVGNNHSTAIVNLDGGGAAIIVLGSTASSSVHSLSLVVLDSAGNVTLPKTSLLDVTQTLSSAYGNAKPYVYGTQYLAAEQLADGSLMVVFLARADVNVFDGNGDYVRTDSYLSLRGQQFDLTGAALNPAFFLTPEVLEENWPRNFDISALADGGFGLAWDQYEADGPWSRGVWGLSVLATSEGTTGDDSLPGTAGTDWIDGLSGNDTIDGLAGADLLEGNLGDDSLFGGLDNDVLYGGAGDDTVFGGSGDDKLYGGDDNDVLVGGAGDDDIRGGVGNDVLNGGTGIDTLDGGLGDDIYLNDGVDLIVEAFGTGTDQVNTGVSYRLGANLEMIVMSGSADIYGIGNALDNRITGNAGDNILNGGTGADTLIGGLGDDIYVTDGGDTLLEAANGGTDQVNASASYRLDANLEILVLSGTANIYGIGNALDNRITGNSGNNILNGGTGVDTLVGGLGNDTYVTDGDDAIFEAAGGGTDQVNSASSYRLGANLENLVLSGGGNIYGIGNALDNRISGNDGNNVLNGAAGADIINAGLGGDTIVGGTGRDIMDSGSDSTRDVFVFQTVADSSVGSVDRDMIHNFVSGTDDINLVGIDANTALGSDQAFVFADTTPQAHAVWYEASAGDVLIKGDVNGDLLADFEIQLVAVSGLSVSDFML